jgi:hypothetical protein
VASGRENERASEARDKEQGTDITSEIQRAWKNKQHSEDKREIERGE